MIELRCRPIDRWDGERTPWRDVRAASFRYKPETQVRDLTRELEHLDAHDVTIGIAALPHQIRVDGWPKRGTAIPPEVVLTFESRVGPLRYQCDRWDSWEDNLRAICLTLTRLRLVEEAGVAGSGEQYRGWQALPSGEPIVLSAAPMERSMALRVLRDASGFDDVSTGDQLRAAYRAAAKEHHPDVGGDPIRWQLIDAAWRAVS